VTNRYCSPKLRDWSGRRHVSAGCRAKAAYCYVTSGCNRRKMTSQRCYRMQWTLQPPPIFIVSSTNIALNRRSSMRNWRSSWGSFSLGCCALLHCTPVGDSITVRNLFISDECFFMHFIFDRIIHQIKRSLPLVLIPILKHHIIHFSHIHNSNRWIFSDLDLG